MNFITEEMKDPVLAIDQLVAELELNTEQVYILMWSYCGEG